MKTTMKRTYPLSDELRGQLTAVQMLLDFMADLSATHVLRINYVKLIQGHINEMQKIAYDPKFSEEFKEYF